MLVGRVACNWRMPTTKQPAVSSSAKIATMSVAQSTLLARRSPARCSTFRLSLLFTISSSSTARWCEFWSLMYRFSFANSSASSGCDLSHFSTPISPPSFAACTKSAGAVLRSRYSDGLGCIAFGYRLSVLNSLEEPKSYADDPSRHCQVSNYSYPEPASTPPLQPYRLFKRIARGHDWRGESSL